MAVISKKDRLVEEAHKLALRGQFDKAANVYEQILALDPTAINLRQKLAELLIKCGRNDDARKELESIGSFFSKNGFFLKAIAVYKQLQKLFPADISLSLSLAELNEKHGLIANSLSEYKLVYEFYEKAGNIHEALGILDRMQNVDPQNIPIKIKLAEAYLQQGKKDESYAVFSKTASLLLERNDNDMLSRICSRIRQFFPDRQDFMVETLSEQIRQGNAATAAESLQSLIRCNPNNKHLWDLIVQAYQLLDQPHRVKAAFQHYLKFFPSEPAAMLGLVSSVTAEQNLAGALELLDIYEAALISGGFLQQLEQVYRSLNKIDPADIRVLEGLARVAALTGNESEERSPALKLQSLGVVSQDEQNDSAGSELPPALIDEQSLETVEAIDFPFLEEEASEQTAVPVSGAPEAERSPAPVPDAKFSDAAFDAVQLPEEEIEIEIEIDLDAPFGLPDQEAGAVSAQDNWLDSVGDLFDSVATAPRGVKFGNEMDNSDIQTHFDLGQAFKEMGLYDEAINEFRQASQDPARRVECLIMQCACLRERGEVEKAVTMLQALLKSGLSEAESCAVKYELASGYESAGKKEEANILLGEIFATNPAFRDIGVRLNAANFSESLDFSDEDLKDF
ncbi:MAG TPA: tetratricopeptide repeat protein [Dongiaceae bacterium]|nr:tetratricopeptide repeat protein [Dongiaceae bacterium]